MKTIILKFSLPMLLAWFIVGTSFAQRGNREFIDSIPGITKEQKIKMASVREANRIEMGELRDKKQQAASWEEKDKIDHQLIDQNAKHRNEMRAILTPDQQKYFDQNFEKRLGKNKAHMGKRHGFFKKDKSCKGNE